MKKLSVYTAALAALILFPDFIGAQTLTWDADRIIDGGNGTANYEPGLVMQGANAVAVWRSSQGGLNRILSCCSTDSGVTWSSEQLVDDGTNGNDKPKIAMSGSNAVVLFKHNTGEGYRYYADYSTDSGVTWHTDSAVSDTILSQDDLKVVISGSNVVALWKQFDGEGCWNMYCDYSVDAGITWHTDRKLEEFNTHAEKPDVVISGSLVVAVWRQRYNNIFRIASNYSTDAGATWHETQIIDGDPENHADVPKLAISGDRIIAVWHQYDGISNNRVYSCYSEDNGATWSTPVIIDNNPGKGNLDPQIAASENRVIVTWRGQYDSTVFRGYAVCSSDSGNTWNIPTLIEDNNYSLNKSPMVAISGEKVVAVWRQSDGSTERIYSNYSTDGGITWDDDRLIEDNDGYNAAEPQLAMSGDNVVAAWLQWDGSKNRIYSNYAVVVPDSMTGDYGSLPVGPLAVGISALLAWWKRRKQRQG